MFRFIILVPLAAAAPAWAADGPPVQEAVVERVAPHGNRPLGTAEAQAMIGLAARTTDGKPAGTIRDFVLATPNGPVERVVLSSGGLFGLGASMVSVPVDRLTVDAPSQFRSPNTAPPTAVTLQLSADDLARAPAFSYGTEEATLTSRK